MSKPAVDIQMPQARRRSALSKTTNPSQESRMALKREMKLVTGLLVLIFQLFIDTTKEYLQDLF